MPLQLQDQIYIQRFDVSSQSFLKLRSTINDVVEIVNIDVGVEINDIANALKLEALMRLEADQNLEDSITGLSNRISDVASEVFSVIVSQDYKYSSSTLCRNNYYLGLSANCGNLSGQDYIDCEENTRDDYVECLASLPQEDTRGKFYLLTSDFTYEKVLSIFVSDQSVTGDLTDWSTVRVGNYIKVIERTIDTNGNPKLNDFNYGFYKVIEIGLNSYPEENDNNVELQRFNVEFISGVGTPSTVDNDFKVQVMSDLSDTVQDDFVNIIGDTMTGALEINIEDNNGDKLDVTGLHVHNNANISRLVLSGLSDTDIQPRLSFWGTQPCDVIIESTDFFVKSLFNGNIFQYHRDDDLITIHKEQLLLEKARYSGGFTFTSSDTYALVYKQYVDTRDEALATAINEVNNRVDTLANVMLVTKYTFNIYDTCDPNVPNGSDPTTSLPFFPNHVQYAQCVSDAIEANKATEIGMFNKQEFLEDYTNPDGNPDQRVVDVMILQRDTYDIDSGVIIPLDFENLVKPGDFVELSALSGRAFAYQIYRVAAVTVDNNSNAVLKLVTLSKVGNVSSGMEFSVKFFDKTSGLTLDEVNDLFVRKDGDVMTGALNIDLPMFDPSSGDLSGTPSLIFRNPSNTSEVTYSVDSLGATTLSSITVIDRDPSVTNTKLIISEDIDFLSNDGVIKSANGKTVSFKFGGTDAFTVGGVSVISAQGNKIRKVADGIASDDAATVGQLSAAFEAGDYINFRTAANGVTKIIEWENCNLHNLLNVSNTSPTDKQALRWNSTNNDWGPGDVSEFNPGDRVATGTEGNTKVGGFYLNASNDLYIRVK